MHILDNNESQKTESHQITIRGNISPVVHDFKLGNSIKMQWSFAKILEPSNKQNNTTTIVIYGEPSTSAEMYFKVSEKPVILNNKEAFSINKNQVKLAAKFNEADKPSEYSFSVGNKTVCILVVNEKLADRIWFVDNNKEKYIICGPSYVGELKINNEENISCNRTALVAKRKP